MYNIKTHLFWFIYLLTVICGSGWYILEQKQTIKEQEKIIVELRAGQLPPIVPEKRKEKIVEKIVTKEVPVKGDCAQIQKAYEEVKKTALQCAYNLKFCQESSEIYNKMKPKENSKESTPKE